MYILSLEIYLLMVIIFCVICNILTHLNQLIDIETEFKYSFFVQQRDNSIIPLIFQTNEVTAEFAFKFTLLGVVSMASFFVIPLTFLVIVQTQNFLLNQTTNKRFSRYKRPTANND